MKTILGLGIAAAIISVAAGVGIAAEPTPSSPAQQPSTQPATPVVAADTAGVVAAANAFLATLDSKQRAQVVYQFDDDKQRKRWSNLPVVRVPRGGLSLKDMSEQQRKAAMSVVAGALSPRGLEKVRQIMAGDEMLKQHPGTGGPLSGRPRGPGRRDGGPGGNNQNGPGGPGPGGNGPSGNGPGSGGPGSGGPGSGGPGPGGPGPGGPGRPRGPMFGGDMYYISFLGTPSDKDPWLLQFGGHHLGLNLTIVGPKGVLTPSHVGVQPALYTIEDGKVVRPLAGENDKAFALLNSLDPDERNRAILNYKVGDLVLGPGHDGETIQPEGLKGSDMTADQRELMLDLISEWANIVNERYAAPRIAEIKAGLKDTYFAWSGPTTHEPGKNGTAYFRVQGPKVVIEFAPQGNDGDRTLHLHTMYRDPTNDYGRASIKADK